MSSVLKKFGLLSFLAWTLPAIAQISITHLDFPGDGFQYVSHQILSGTSFDVGSAGSGQSWSFEVYEWEHNEHTGVSNPEDTPYGESFPTATRAISALDGDSYLYEQIEPDACYMLGNASSAGITVLDPAMVVMVLPAEYQSQWSSVIRVTQEPEPGFVVSIVDSAHVTVDGWGTASTQFGEFNVLRFFTHHFNETYLNGELLTESQFLSYAWVNDDGIAIVNVDSDVDDVNPNFSYGIIEMNEFAMPVGPESTALPRALMVGQNYPNPFNPTTVLPIELTKNGLLTLHVFDATGRLLTSQALNLSAGKHELEIDGNNWPTGSYFTKVMSGEQTITKRMLLVK